MTTLVVYPDADPESTTVDGHVRRSSVDQTFAAIIAGAGVAFSDTVALGNSLQLTASTTSNQFSVLRRSIYLFDTSSIPGGATVSSAVFSLYGSSKSNGLGEPEMDVVSSNPASNTALVNGDYSVLGSSVYGSVTYAGYSTAGYNDITISTGAVTLAGITKLGVRLNWDTDASFGGAWSSGAASYFESYYADQAGTTNDPKLTVVYSTGGAARRVMVVS